MLSEMATMCLVEGGLWLHEPLTNTRDTGTPLELLGLFYIYTTASQQMIVVPPSLTPRTNRVEKFNVSGTAKHVVQSEVQFNNMG